MLKICTLLAFVLAVALAFTNSYTYDWPTGDEHWHFAYSQRMLHEGILERESVHNFISTTPFVTLNVIFDEYLTKLGVTAGWDKFIVRVPAVAWYVLLLTLTYCASMFLFGDFVSYRTAACWATLLTCLDQILLGQGSHVGSDIPFAAMTLIFLMAMEAYRRKPSIKSALVVGVVLGLTFNVKYSASFLLFFALVGMPLIYISHLIKTKSFGFVNALSVLGHLAAIGAIVSLTVDAAYGFQEIGRTFSDKIWYSDLFKGLAETFPHIPLPWPLPFVAGFDHQFAVERTWSWSSVLLGQEFPSGVWYYFPVVWLVKTPLAIFGIVALALGLGFTKLRELFKNGPFMITFCLFAYLITYFCFVFRTQVGIRYTLMCLPLGYLMLGYILSTWFEKTERMTQTILPLFLFLGVGYEASPYLGNNLSFTNSILSDKTQAYAWITDSNIDWFHNYTRAKAMASAKLGNYYFNPRHLLPGDNVFTINTIAGVMRNFSQHAWIRKNLTPTGSFGHTLVWYKSDQPTFERFMSENRSYTPPASAPTICPPDRVYHKLENGTSTEFGGDWKNPALYTACLKVTEPALLELTVADGYGAFGNYPAEFNCAGDEAGKGESLWFKLAPGTYPICARIMAKAKANWTVHQGQVELALRTQ